MSAFDPKRTLAQRSGALVQTFAAREYNRPQYGCLSLRANQRLQASRAQHRHRRRAIRIFDRSRNKDAASIHNPNDSGAPLKWRPLPSFADQVRRETGTALREMNGVRRMSLPLSISKSKAVAMAT